MICTSTSGMTISSSERPNIVCGRSRFSQLRWRRSSAAAVKPAASPPGATASLGLEGIADPPRRLQIARIARVLLDLAAQPGHLHIHIADVAAKLRRLRQILARDRFAGALGEARQQALFGGGQVDDRAVAKQFAAREIKAKGAKAQRPHGFIAGRGAAVEDV